MKSFIEMIRKITPRGWITGIVFFAAQYGIYRLGNWLSVVFGTVAWAIEPKIPVLDDLFPVMPFFALPYLLCYLLWIIAPAVASLTKRRNYINYLCGLTLAYLIGFLIFFLMPTYMDRAREGLMNHAAGHGIFNWMLNVIYSADGSEKAFNLFPSFHCMISAYCYLGIMNQPEVTKGYRIYTLVFAVIIVLSTLFTKQHYFIDCVGGIALAGGCYLLMKRLDPGSRYSGNIL